MNGMLAAKRDARSSFPCGANATRFDQSRKPSLQGTFTGEVLKRGRDHVDADPTGTPCKKQRQLIIKSFGQTLWHDRHQPVA
jgi:hypothetical protein